MIVKYDYWKEIKGVFVGGCVDRGEGSSFRAKAHAHNQTKSKNFGWICFRSAKRLGNYVCNDDGTLTILKPSRTLWHEYAHILTPNHGHDDIWRVKMKELKQPLSKQYDKRKRHLHAWVFVKDDGKTLFEKCVNCDMHKMTCRGELR